MDNASLHDEYVQKLSHVSYPSFDSIRDAAMAVQECFSKSEMDEQYAALDRGKAIIDREELLWQYLRAYGRKHKRHLDIALRKLPDLKRIVGQGYSIVDWGCGQGLATVCMLDYLRASGLELLPEQVTLVEPSALALENAKLHVSLYGVEVIKPVQKLLDDVTDDDIRVDAPITIHLFSNILDVDGFDLKRIAELVSDNAQGDSYVVCVSPRYSGDRRLFSFKDSFQNIEVYASQSDVRPSEEVCASYAVFKFTPNVSSVIQVKYYPLVQFFAAYQLDSIAALGTVRHDEDPPLWSSFEVAAPFELGGCVYDDVHPVLAVLNNIVTRGLPTKCSPFLEEAFADYGESPLPDRLGTISFDGYLSDDRVVRFAQVRTPVGVARIQKTVLEALICGRLSLDSKEWRVLVRERDVPCAALAFEDLSQMLNHLTAMTRDYRNLSMPKVDLTVIGVEVWASSPLHLGVDVRTEVSDELRSKLYDMVIDVSTHAPLEVEELEFSEFRARNDCYFAIGSSECLRSVRKIYTSDVITYLPLGSTDRSGLFEEDKDVVTHLTYFLNLLFRKRNFRPGQVPILNRALQNKNVIGLLPTGGGKSLTYQLAALLQPGVTVVVDPLRSLMQDQYDGLREMGVDAAAFINSTVSPSERHKREGKMETSELQFVFLAPERLCIYEFRERLKTMHEMNVYFAYGVIDEVHCVSEWGHDFRFSYLHLGRNMYQYVRAKDLGKRLTLFGLTATASFDVLSDVERELSGDGAYPLDANTIVRYENTDRLELQYKVERVAVDFDGLNYPNLGVGLPKARNTTWSRFRANDCKSLYLASHIHRIPAEVEELQTDESVARICRRFSERQNESEVLPTESLVNADISDMLAKHAAYDQAAIVFCPHKKSTGVSVDVNRNVLKQIVPDIGTFVGSSDNDSARDEESFKNLSRFKNNEQPLMIATKAFGMGIDKPNVRFTVNMNYPSSLESFVQEAGRAGRDRRIALATILVSDYRLVRVSPACPITTWPIPKIKEYWYREEDLATLLQHFGGVVPQEFVDVATPEDDWVMTECHEAGEDDSKEERKRRRDRFNNNSCDSFCSSYQDCTLRRLPPELRGWHKYSEVEDAFERLRISKANLVYMNADYGNNMYFYNSNFKGEREEKRVLYELFCKTEMDSFVDADVERRETHKVTSLLDVVLSLKAGKKLVAFVPYEDRKKDKGQSYSSVQKAIYRMCCIGFIDDFTEDYGRHQFRLVMIRKVDGGYYDGLRRFLTRYYANERAEELVKLVRQRRGENEVQKCLGFLTEFIYGKIAVKRKRALDDVRMFCAMGTSSGKDWKETNEDLKDFIYYYFNSKYARDEYVADNGEQFSLTTDTDWGKRSLSSVVMKYLRVTDDDLVGAGGTPIDNVKHLQGAVRLIRRSLTDDNPALDLLNYFCLTQLGTNGSEALEQEMFEDYRTGITGFVGRFETKMAFWQFKEQFDYAVETKPHRFDLSRMESLQSEVTAQIHLESLREIRRTYAGYKRKRVKYE